MTDPEPSLSLSRLNKRVKVEVRVSGWNDFLFFCIVTRYVGFSVVNNCESEERRIIRINCKGLIIVILDKLSGSMSGGKSFIQYCS